MIKGRMFQNWFWWQYSSVEGLPPDPKTSGILYWTKYIAFVESNLGKKGETNDSHK